jgi:serine/threonine-protein kinase
VARAIDCFEHALAHDPTFAQAGASLAIAFIDLAEQGWTEPEGGYRRAAEAVANALRHDPGLAEAHAAAGHLKAVRERDWAGAERELKRALELDPDEANVHDLYGRFCLGLGRVEEALALHRRAQELDPLSHRFEVVATLLRAGRHHEAMVGAHDAVELEPNHDRSRAMLGWAFYLSGRRGDGVAELERAVKLSPGASVWLGQLGQAYGMAGEREMAHEILEELETRGERGYVSPVHLAYVYTGLGDHDGAVECLVRATAERSAAIYAIRGSFLFVSLYGRPGFEALLSLRQ